LKRIRYIFYIIFLVLILLFIIVRPNTIQNQLVYIEALNDEYSSTGMGFVYKIENKFNYIVTSYHVIHNCEDVYVYNYENDKIKAEIINYDTYTDLALLKIDDKLNLKEMKISYDDVNINDEVYYLDIVENNLNKGKILDLETEIFLNANYGNSFYQGVSIEGNIEKGNSGGPILNKRNELIGLIALKANDKKTSIYIPIVNVINIVTKLENHSLKRPNLGGVFVSSNNNSVLEENNIAVDSISGVVVLDTMKDYPLYKASIKKGDILIKVNDTIISNVNELQKEIYSYSIGDIIMIEYYRNNKLNKVDIFLNKY